MDILWGDCPGKMTTRLGWEREGRREECFSPTLIDGYCTTEQEPSAEIGIGEEDDDGFSTHWQSHLFEYFFSA